MIKIYQIIIFIIIYVKQNYKNILLNEEEEMKEYFEIYIDDNKIDFCFEYILKIKINIKIKLNVLNF